MTRTGHAFFVESFQVPQSHQGILADEEMAGSCLYTQVHYKSYTLVASG